MSYHREQILATGEYYHIFNRSVGNEEVFHTTKHKQRFLDLAEYYQYSQQIRFSLYLNLPKEQKEMYLSSYRKQVATISVHAYSIMPNHYHLLIKQETDNGIAKFTSNIQNSYAKYYNILNNRHGSVFQNPFKAKLVETDGELLHLSRYIHLNPVTSYLINVDDLEDYPWTSFREYLSTEKSNLIKRQLILKLAGSPHKYKAFVENQADFQRKLKIIRGLLFDQSPTTSKCLNYH